MRTRGRRSLIHNGKERGDESSLFGLRASYALYCFRGGCLDLEFGGLTLQRDGPLYSLQDISIMLPITPHTHFYLSISSVASQPTPLPIKTSLRLDFALRL